MFITLEVKGAVIEPIGELKKQQFFYVHYSLRIEESL